MCSGLKERLITLIKCAIKSSTGNHDCTLYRKLAPARDISMKRTLMSTVTVIFAQHFNRSENYDCTEGTSNDQSEPQSREYFSPALRVIVFTEHGSVWSRKGAARPLLLLRLYFYSSRAFQESLYIRARPLFSRFSEHLNTPRYARLRAATEKIFA